jgi:hypothetical protein
MLPSLLHVIHLMRPARAGAHEEGLAIAFPFKPGEVAAVHTSFHKHGHGVCFRLKDGRVFSAWGIERDPHPARYDAPAILPGPPPPRARPARTS